MQDMQTQIEEHRAALMAELPPEHQALVRYIDLRFDASDAKTEELFQVFKTGKGVIWLMWRVAGFLALCATIWAGFKAKITVGG